MSNSSRRIRQQIRHSLLLTTVLIVAFFPFISESRLAGTRLDSQDEQSELLLNLSPPPSSSTAPETVFPTLDETLHLAYLSSLVYEFRHHLGDDKPYCETFNEFNRKNSTSQINPFHGVECIWYHVESSLGTQVLIVSNDDRKYLSVVFAGTDDLRTTLEDTNISLMKFGSVESNVHIPLNTTNAECDHDLDPDYYYDHAKIHSGFNHAVFTHDIYRQVEQQIVEFYQQTGRWRPLHRVHQDYKLYLTGHSLGAANALLTSVALSLRSKQHDNGGLQKYLPKTIISINFGCPQTGNIDWKDYVNDILLMNGNASDTSMDFVDHSDDILHNSNSKIGSNVSLWRVVLGFDLVPRLPEFFSHVGHTIQVWSKNHKSPNYDPIMIQFGDFLFGGNNNRS